MDEKVAAPFVDGLINAGFKFGSETIGQNLKGLIAEQRHITPRFFLNFLKWDTMFDDLKQSAKKSQERLQKLRRFL